MNSSHQIPLDKTNGRTVLQVSMQNCKVLQVFMLRSDQHNYLVIVVIPEIQVHLLRIQSSVLNLVAVQPTTVAVYNHHNLWCSKAANSAGLNGQWCRICVLADGVSGQVLVITLFHKRHYFKVYQSIHVSTKSKTKLFVCVRACVRACVCVCVCHERKSIMLVPAALSTQIDHNDTFGRQFHALDDSALALYYR